MGQPEQFSLRWSEYEGAVSCGLRDLHIAGDLHDVTLVVDDGSLSAHRVVLASCSPFFRRVLTSCKHHSPLLYLRGVPRQELASLLDFMYRGEVSIGQDRLAGFLAVAEELQVKGLTNSGEPEGTKVPAPSPPKVNRRKMTFSPSFQSSSKKARLDSPQATAPALLDSRLLAPQSPALQPTETPSAARDDPIAARDDPIAAPEEDSIAAVQVKAEPSKEQSETAICKARSEDDGDFAVGFGAVSYNDYQDDPSVYDHDDLAGHYGGHIGDLSGSSFAFASSEQEAVRNRRQLILQFITANKGRLSDTYVCLICNKQVTDNSNMNKHLEFKHGTELKLFLQSLAL